MSQRVLSFHYTLTNNQGQPLDSSRQSEPLAVLEGSRVIIPALEKELLQMNVGDTKKVELKAEDAYGQFDEALKTKVKRAQLPGDQLAVGTRFQTGPEQGNRVFTVTEIVDEEVHLDGNHPLAGVDLIFDVELIELREATEEDLAHGHGECCSDPDCEEEK